MTAPAIWNAANAQGTPIGLFNIPMTYPAPAVDGFSVSGMLTPEGGGETPENFTYPSELGSKISERVGKYEIDIEVDYAEDWKSTDDHRATVEEPRPEEEGAQLTSSRRTMSRSCSRSSKRRTG